MLLLWEGPEGDVNLAWGAEGQIAWASEPEATYGSFVAPGYEHKSLQAADVSDEHLSLLGCGVTSGVGAVVNLAEVSPGSSVAVVGAGALGLWMIQGARVAGAATIIAVEPRAERRELARRVGATDLVRDGLARPRGRGRPTR